MIYGNKEGIRDSLLAKLETLYDIEIPAEVFAPAELLDVLAAFTCAINREISIYVSRSGEVLDITIGGVSSVELKDMHLRRNTKRLSMVRCIHTHPGGNPQLSDVDISSLRAMRFDAMAAVGAKDGHATGIQAAFLGEYVGGMNRVHLTEVAPVYKLPQRAWMDAIERADSEVLIGAPNTTKEDQERAFLVGLDSDESLLELARLAETAGAQVIGTMLQRKTRPDTATYIGSGKADELSLACQAREADVVIFDDELSGVQTRNLEEILHGAKVIDRTTLILDIFAQRAQSREGRLQVELAQMAYQLPRLLGHGVAMSRLGGGIGTRGPGETRLEMDRRRIRRRMSDLRREIDDLSGQRNLRRAKREKNKVPVVALVGYTNAGKSTLLNTLSGADVLLVISDGASGEMIHQHDVVLEVLASLGAADKPKIDVINKADLPDVNANKWPGAIAVSAKTGKGLDELLEAIRLKLRGAARLMRALIPYAQGGLLAKLHEDGQVLSEEYTGEGIEVKALADEQLFGRLTVQLGEQAVSWQDD